MRKIFPLRFAFQLSYMVFKFKLMVHSSDVTLTWFLFRCPSRLSFQCQSQSKRESSCLTKVTLKYIFSYSSSGSLNALPTVMELRQKKTRPFLDMGRLEIHSGYRSFPDEGRTERHAHSISKNIKQWLKGTVSNSPVAMCVVVFCFGKRQREFPTELLLQLGCHEKSQGRLYGTDCYYTQHPNMGTKG